MSLLNGITALGPALTSFAGNLAKDEELNQRIPLLERGVPREAPAPDPAKPGPYTGPSSDSATRGNALDPETISRAHQVYLGLVQRGMDPETAIGFAANAVQESRANPATDAGDMGASHGLMQWRDDRYAGFQSKFGNSTNLDDHLDYVMHEISGPEAKAWQAIQAAAQDPASKAVAVSQFYERPKDTAAEIVRRGFIANQLAGHFSRLALGSSNEGQG